MHPRYRVELLVFGVFACSSGSPAERVEDPLQPSAGGAAGSGSDAAASGSAGSGGGALGSGVGGTEGQGPIGLAGASGSAGAAGAPPSTGAGADAGVPDQSATVCPPGPFPDNPLAGAAEPTLVCGDMIFTEGPVWFHERGTLFFSDFDIGGFASSFDGRIMRHVPGQGCEEFIAGAGTNGLAIAPDGNLLSCRHVDRTLTIFDLETRQPSVFIADNEGDRFNSPNDVVVRSDGNLYFTDPTFLLAGRPSELPARAYRRAPNGALTVIDQTGNTNGIALSPDENRLYLSHLGGQGDVIVFDVAADGSVGEAQPFANVGSDGMAVDCAGNLYITQGGVRVFAPSGEPIGTLAVPGAANVAFGGAERRTLFITAEEALYAVDLAIPGLPY